MNYSKTSSGAFRVVIVGGGIAGLCAAVALRGPNRDIQVLEQSSLLKEVGAAISLQPNASKILENNWGLGAKLPATKKVVDHGFRIYSIDGDLVKEIPLVQKREYGADRIIYHRQDLHSMLKAAATSSDLPGKPAELRLSSRVIDADCNAGIVFLEDGSSVYGDLIVGADGIHSKLRTFVLGNTQNAIPTGVSAYRLMIPIEKLQGGEFASKINPADPFTSMMMGYDRRLVMGPCRGTEDYAIVALVPDKTLDVDTSTTTWSTEASLDEIEKAFEVFPRWVTSIFRHSPAIGLWQLRDLDPLDRWHRGRVMLIGDASHAMLPTQGQGASQSVEDAEALGAFFEDVDSRISGEDVERRLANVFCCRYERASLIQEYSRNAARPATAQGAEGRSKVTLTSLEFMDYNCSYNGAKDHLQRLQASAK
ncbi:uncharacterized protein J3D65DRAFT_550899 [Phyllosticta citribraziliensis]|uniref:FAD-binding domain-containing protein n=1 Tax=Phyllosticta citribraziliensis TaxID=989973 RepID=A0ABR1LYG3_9PEZI